MILKLVRAHNFRNLGKFELDVSARVNIFLGRNGQGKSNLLEALSYLTLGRSWRGARDSECIAFGEDEFHIRVDALDRDGDPLRLSAHLQRSGAKTIKVDSRALERRSDLVGRFPSVQFAPDEVELGKGAPEGRRRFLDQTLSLVSPEYLRQLVEYRRAVAQKNRLLKQRPSAGAPELGVWDAELVRNGTKLLRARAAFRPELEELARAAYADLAPGAGDLSLSIRSNVLPSKKKEELPSDAEIETRFIQALADARGREAIMRHSLCGPHRDRLELELGGRSLRRYGSQGEMRSASIALKLAQGELLFRHIGERPAVFLDDIFSELDRQRTLALQQRLHHEHQLFIATARLDDVLGMQGWDDCRAWLVEDGRLEPIQDLGRVDPRRLEEREGE